MPFDAVDAFDFMLTLLIERLSMRLLGVWHSLSAATMAPSSAALFNESVTAFISALLPLRALRLFVFDRIFAQRFCARHWASPGSSTCALPRDRFESPLLRTPLGDVISGLEPLFDSLGDKASSSSSCTPGIFAPWPGSRGFRGASAVGPRGPHRRGARGVVAPRTPAAHLIAEPAEPADPAELKLIRLLTLLPALLSRR
mmetsp:Transcript_62350/g.114045  ORF Transcript_62350/g.114045 Transcript_62350/m.114045 type:complete len:200 (+) Transcript_62350:373-972(+)